MKDVMEEHPKSREQQANPGAEQHDEDDQHGKQDDLPGWEDLEIDHDADGRNEREGEVHQGEEDLLHGEDGLLDANLLDERRGIDDGLHRRGRRRAHETEEDVAQDKIQRKVLDVELEHVREHRGHDDHHEQRVEHRPHDAQDAATVLDLEVLGHERGEHAPVLLELAARYIALFACCHIRKARA